MNRIKFFFVSLISLISFSAHSQTYIKTNALYWMALLPNAQVETYLGEHFTFQGEINGSLWNDIGDGKPFRGVQFISGVRYYPRESFKGFYVGGDFSFDMYDAVKWDHKSDYFHDVQHGVGYYLGVTLGYQISIGDRWNLDFFTGGGWHLGKYWGERFYNNGTTDVYATWNGSGEWIPYKLGVTFSYRLTSQGRMAARRSKK